MKLIIDRFEEEFAVVEYTGEDGREHFENIPRILIPGASEGDVIEISINRSESQERRRKIEKLMDNLFE